MRIFDAVKQVCENVLSSSVFCDVFIGKVISDNPINVKISDKLILDESQLVFSRNVCNFKTEITLSPQNSQNPENEEDYRKRTEIIVYNRLNIGESVIILRSFDGQKFFVVDRVC